jgi:hypothetical protein
VAFLKKPLHCATLVLAFPALHSHNLFGQAILNENTPEKTEQNRAQTSIITHSVAQAVSLRIF